jgi:hypothetical protein
VQAQLGREGGEPLVVVAVALGAGVFDAAPGGESVGVPVIRGNGFLLGDE